MRKTKMAIAAGAIASLLAALALGTWTTASAAPQTLVGSVGPGYTIGLKTASGKRVVSLRPGTYVLRISDRSEDHNFFLRGPGLSKQITGVDFVGTKTVTVKLRSGKYGFVCTPHSDEMQGRFGVR
jgi:plastocyanin